MGNVTTEPHTHCVCGTGNLSVEGHTHKEETWTGISKRSDIKQKAIKLSDARCEHSSQVDLVKKTNKIYGRNKTSHHRVKGVFTKMVIMLLL